MFNKFFNIYHASTIFIVIAIVLSFFLHLIIITFLLNSVICIENMPVFINKNKKMVTMLFFGSCINTKPTFQKKHLPLISDINSCKKDKTLHIHKKHKILENSEHILDSNQNSYEVNKKDIDDNISCNQVSSIECIDKIDDDTINSTPFIIKYYHPKYPNTARLLGIEGEVNIMYDVNIKGKVEKIRILSSVSPGIFEENIKLAMRRWTYEQNKPKKNLIITFKFSLNNVYVSAN